MILLLDTHVWVWSLADPARLLAKVACALRCESNELWLSPLRAADPSVHSVIDIALENGFPHLGRFSVDYRLHFNESPSETLSRSKIGAGGAEATRSVPLVA